MSGAIGGGASTRHSGDSHEHSLVNAMQIGFQGGENQGRPCACGNTQDPNGNCDGSHNK